METSNKRPPGQRTRAGLEIVPNLEPLALSRCRHLGQPFVGGRRKWASLHQLPKSGRTPRGWKEPMNRPTQQANHEPNRINTGWSLVIGLLTLCADMHAYIQLHTYITYRDDLHLNRRQNVRQKQSLTLTEGTLCTEPCHSSRLVVSNGSAIYLPTLPLLGPNS